jgi:hypothetical protein
MPRSMRRPRGSGALASASSRRPTRLRAGAQALGRLRGEHGQEGRAARLGGRARQCPGHIHPRPDPLGSELPAARYLRLGEPAASSTAGVWATSTRLVAQTMSHAAANSGQLSETWTFQDLYDLQRFQCGDRAPARRLKIEVSPVRVRVSPSQAPESRMPVGSKRPIGLFRPFGARRAGDRREGLADPRGAPQPRCDHGGDHVRRGAPRRVAAPLRTDRHRARRAGRQRDAVLDDFAAVVRGEGADRLGHETLSCPNQAYILALFTGHIASQTRVLELARLQAIPAVFECSEHLSENRGVPGSSPGLAIGRRPGNRGFSRG